MVAWLVGCSADEMAVRRVVAKVVDWAGSSGGARVCCSAVG